MENYLLIVVLSLCYLFIVKCSELDDLQSNNKCIKIQRTEKVSNVYESGPCIKSFKDRCSWFSLDLCTFYKQEVCDSNHNITQYTYSKVIVCCDGFIEAPNKTCISKDAADPKWIQIVNENNTDVENVVYVNKEDIPSTPQPMLNKGPQTIESKDEGIGISKGVLAGIACVALFIVVVVGFTIIGVRKRRKRASKKETIMIEDRDEAGQNMLTTST